MYFSQTSICKYWADNTQSNTDGTAVSSPFSPSIVYGGSKGFTQSLVLSMIFDVLVPVGTNISNVIALKLCLISHIFQQQATMSCKLVPKNT